ncbi:hypothetical protein GGR56DRAFT_655233 [Xylariaceae sp. FL0804]|nr:hypothetical protein GGR56DRAFT_655233 [Xylariaceae sp. FL0804]
MSIGLCLCLLVGVSSFRGGKVGHWLLLYIRTYCMPGSQTVLPCKTVAVRLSTVSPTQAHRSRVQKTLATLAILLGLKDPGPYREPCSITLM